MMPRSDGISPNGSLAPLNAGCARVNETLSSDVIMLLVIINKAHSVAMYERAFNIYGETCT